MAKYLTLSNAAASFSGTIEISDDLFEQLVQAVSDRLGAPEQPSAAPEPPAPPAPVDPALGAAIARSLDHVSMFPMKAAYDALAVHHTKGMTFDDATGFLGRAISDALEVVADEAAIEIAYKWPSLWPTLRRSLKGYIEGALRNHGLME